MKKRLILLSLLLFTITGCTVQYDLEIDNTTISEKTTVKIPKTGMTKEEANVYAKQEIPITQNSQQDQFYDTDISENQSDYYLSFKYLHNLQTFQNSYFVKQCYETLTLKETPTQLELTTSDLFMCINLQDGFHVNSAQINITTKLNVINNNADQVNDNIYTWYINENNYQNKPIKMILQKPQNKEPVKNITVNSASKESFIIYGSIGIILLIILIIMKIRIKRNNKI